MIKDKISPVSLLILVITAWGGILFGYHTAILSGILDRLSGEFSLSTLDQGIIVSLVLLGGLFGALLAGAAADRWGRKKTLLATGLIFTIGALIQAMSYSYSELMFGRGLTGIGVGLASVVCPLYIAEFAPSYYRGSFVCFYQLMVAGGILLAYGMNLMFEHALNWRILFNIALILAFLQFVALFFIPESPSWLLKTKLKKTTPSTTLPSRIYRIFFIGVLLSMFQQITGINTVIYYAPTVFSKSQALSTNEALWAALLVGGTSFAFTIISVIFLDKFGRRLFLLIGVTAMILGQMLLAFPHLFPFASITGALIFVSGFSIGLGPITWVILAEIYPLSIRGKAMGFALFANWFSNYIVTLTFPVLAAGIGMENTFMAYGFISVLCLIFVALLIPETKGKTLEELEALILKGKL